MMRNGIPRLSLVVALFITLAACYQVQVKGPVANATITFTELGQQEVLAVASSWNTGLLIDTYGAQAWSTFDDFTQLALVGVFAGDPRLFDTERLYLLRASGGEDLDVDQDQVADLVASAVQSDWHAIVPGSDLKKGGIQVSALTEVVYQYLAPALGNLSDADLRAQLDLLAQRLVGDVSGDAIVDYRDVLEWSRLFDSHQLLADNAQFGDFEEALLADSNPSGLQAMAVAIVESGAPRTGEMVYRFTQASGNSFSCASCHALVEPSQNGFQRPGHPLGSATRRPHYKDGQLDTMLDAVNSCLDEWMNAQAWNESSPEWMALQSWLDEQAAPGAAPPVDIQIVEPPAVLSGGDATAGREAFNESCAICHAEDGSGSIQAPPVVGFGLDASLVANRVRKSGRVDGIYQGLTGGVMPFWGANRLGDGDLLDIVAYIAQGEDTGETGDPDGGGGDSQCAADHPKVGQSTVLTTRAHGVRGLATIVDNCTIELSQFNYDGRGIVVQAYTGTNGNFFGSAARAISADLVGPRYSNATLRFTLPDTLSLDDFNSLSIWCVQVGVSFGDGIFR